MSGYDEGNVYYQNQGMIQEAAGDDADVLTRATVKRKFREFLAGFRDGDELVYRDKCEQLRRSDDPHKVLSVRMEHLQRFDDELAGMLRNEPAEYLPLFEVSAADLIAMLQVRVADGEDESALIDVEVTNVQVLLSSNEEPKKLRELTAENISKQILFSGIVTAASRPKSKATLICLRCRTCGHLTSIQCKPGIGGAIKPRRCGASEQQQGPEGCPLDPDVELEDKSKYVDQQTLKLQEVPEDVPAGELPRSAMLVLDRSLVGRVAPGTRMTCTGIYSIYSADKKSGSKANLAALRQPYIRVVGIDEESEGNNRNKPTFTPAEVTEFKEFAKQPGIYEALRQRIAPSIYGGDDIKRAVAALLFGGSRKQLPDGTRLRGDVNVLMLGDPSTAKSQFLKFVEKTAPISVYTSGKGSSAAGLTASVVRDMNNEFYLEGGAMVLADGGVVCIDEFDKMRPEDRVAIHEAMEQQTISIAKAGITTVLNSRCSVLAAANPPSGHYDEMADAQDNIEMQSTILSRFDLIFLVKDERLRDRDLAIAAHVVGVHSAAGQTSAEDNEEEAERERFIRRYVEYARHHVYPRLTEEAALRLRDKYVSIREQSKQSQLEHGVAPVPITVRQLEAIVRVTEAHAKMRLSNVATEADVEQAVRLFEVSTEDASKAGLDQDFSPNAEQLKELQGVEEQIKRHVAIGQYIGEKSLVSNLERYGYTTGAVRRALLAMAKRGEVDFRRERKTIMRVS